jgi:hypothetical protein
MITITRLLVKKYGISYQQVAAWVRKYKKNDSGKRAEPVKKETKKATQPQASTLDVLNRKDPVLEVQLHEVKKRLGLI